MCECGANLHTTWVVRGQLGLVVGAGAGVADSVGGHARHDARNPRQPFRDTSRGGMGFRDATLLVAGGRVVSGGAVPRRQVFVAPSPKMAAPRQRLLPDRYC